MEEGGFETPSLLSCEGITTDIDEPINEATGELWDACVDMSYRPGKGPSTHGAAGHLLYAGRTR